MEWLNYHHLFYFWTVARVGSITEATEELRLAPSTISSQIRQLEENFGRDLFERTGRKLVLTEFGKTVFRYADEIFNIGRELLNYVHGRSVGGPMRLNVGVTSMIPKLVVRNLLEPIFELDQEVHLIVTEGSAQQLVSDLARHHLDIALADAPVGPESPVKTFNHLLSASPVALFGTEEHVEQLRDDFPMSLDGAPMLLPTSATVVRRLLDQWFDSLDIYPRVVAEFQDAAQLKSYGATGIGVFPAAAVVADEIESRYSVVQLGTAGEVKESFYAISVERQIEHPAVIAILEQ